MLLSNLDVLATGPGGVARLRELILTLAVQGKLVPQDPADEPASQLLKKIRAEKDRLIAEGKIKRDKPLADIAEDEQPFELPLGWEWVRIPDVTHGLGQGEPTTSFSYIDVAAIDNAKGCIAQEVQVLEAAEAPSRARKNVAQGTVIYSTVRPYLRNIAIVERDYQPRAIASTAFAVMHPHTGLLPQYLLHYLRSQPFTDFVNSKAVGVAYPAINDANFFQGVVPLPPLAEQSRIVTRVEELMRLCDALEAKGRLEAAQHAQLVTTLLATLTDSATPEALADNWQRLATHFDTLLDRPEAVDALEQTVLQLAVRGLLVPQDPADEPASVLLKHIRSEKDRLIAAGQIKRDKPLPPITDDEKPFELPAGWEWVRIGDLAGIERGGSPRPIEAFITSEASGLNWIKIGDTERGGKYITSASQKIKPEGLVKTRMVYPGDFLLTNSMSFGRPYITQIEGCIHDGWLRISPPASLDKDYLYELLSSSFIREVFSAAAAGGVVLNLNADKVRGVAIPLPPLAEQSRIVTRVESLRRLCADLRQRLSASQIAQARLAEALVESVSN